MRNQQIGEIFSEMADIMEILGEDHFRIATYRKVARVIHDCTAEVADLAAENRLQELPGVGKSSAEKINEFVNLGSILAHQVLLRKIPPGLLDLLKIPGMGPKGVAAVWKGLEVTNLAQLQQAIDEHRLEELPGFGVKKAESLARGITFVEAAQGRILLCNGIVIAETVIGRLLTVCPVRQIEFAGSVRRGCETIGDIDILAQAENGQEVVDHFTRLDGVRRVLAAGNTKGSIVFGDPMICPDMVQVDLRVVPAQSMGAAWQYFTGSKYHNVRLREIAGKKKLKLNEYGLFRGEKFLAGETERQIYEKLDLPYIPPPMRENHGEIELARKGQLPAVVDLNDIRGDLHIHSPASDGRATVEEVVRGARQHRYDYIAITDHSQSSVIANGLDAKRLLANIKKIKKLDQSLKDFTVLASTEVDIRMEGSLDYPDEVLAELDFVIASIHSGMKGSAEKLTARLLRAMENPYVNCIGHPTGRMINVREPMQLDIAAVIAQAVQTNTALEISASPLRLDLKDTHCRRAVEAGAKFFINTDAHDVEGLGHMRFGVVTAQRGWVKKSDVLNCQPIQTIRDWVKRKRPS